LQSLEHVFAVVLADLRSGRRVAVADVVHDFVVVADRHVRVWRDARESAEGRALRISRDRTMVPRVGRRELLL
jgi:hypothetical protein